MIFVSTIYIKAVIQTAFHFVYTKKIFILIMSMSYNIDVMKINHALDISKYVYVYWLDNKELVQITNKLNFIK